MESRSSLRSQRGSLALVETDQGWAIALRHEKGELEQLSFAFPSKALAERFQAITRVDLGFVPSALPAIAKRLTEGA